LTAVVFFTADFLGATFFATKFAAPLVRSTAERCLHVIT
jgi:hypothetical protein